MSENILDAFKEDHSAKKEIDMSKKLRVGIIGTGWIAEAHVKAYQKCPDVEIVALADLIPGKAEAFCERYNVGENVKFFPSHKELIDSGMCDAVSVCTYNATHAECTIYALNHGVSVLLEKPMCVTLDEAVAAQVERFGIVTAGHESNESANDACKKQYFRFHNGIMLNCRFVNSDVYQLPIFCT